VSARTLSSLLWTLLVLVPPVRGFVQRVSAALWPEGGVFRWLSLPSPRWIPFLAFVVIGYVVVWALIRFLLIPYVREVDRNPAVRKPNLADDFYVPTGRLDGASALALFATAAWVTVALGLGALSIPWLAAAGLIALGVIRQGHLPRGRDLLPEPVPVPPAPLPPPPRPPTTPEEEDGGAYYRTYRWWYDKTPYRRSSTPSRLEMSLVLPKSDYEEFRGRSHTVGEPGAMVGFANGDLDGRWVLETAAKLREITTTRHLDDLAEIHLAMAFTLSILYADDAEEYGGEYPKFPLETLVDKRGDCEDHAILCGVILHALGHRTALVLMGVDPGIGHAALAVEARVPGGGTFFEFEGQEFYYCEVTPTGESTTETTPSVQWWLGMEPPPGAHGFTLYSIG
jgi:predicted transglutaminase-like cysteine proteinase